MVSLPLHTLTLKKMALSTKHLLKPREAKMLLSFYVHQEDRHERAI